jgi:hypothetical protein
MMRLKDRLNDAGFAGLWDSELGYIIRLGNARAIFLSAEESANVVGNTAHILLEIDESQDVSKDKYTKDFKPMGATTNVTTIHYGTTWDEKTSQELCLIRVSFKTMPLAHLPNTPTVAVGTSKSPVISTLPTGSIVTRLIYRFIKANLASGLPVSLRSLIRVMAVESNSCEASSKLRLTVSYFFRISSNFARASFSSFFVA